MTNEKAPSQDRENALRVRMLADTIGMLSALENEFGPGVQEVVRKQKGAMAQQQFEQMSREQGLSTIADLLRVLFEPAKRLGIEYTQTDIPGGVQMHVTRCPWHEWMKAVKEVAHDLDAYKWGHVMFCSTDPYITEGFTAWPPKFGH